jgi:hypothetical protein
MLFLAFLLTSALASQKPQEINYLVVTSLIATYLGSYFNILTPNAESYQDYTYYSDSYDYVYENNYQCDRDHCYDSL